MANDTQPSRGPMRVLTTAGVRDLRGLTDEEATEVGRHWNAVRRYLEQGDDSGLSEFRYRLIRRYELETSTAVVEWHAIRGEVSFESIYNEVI